MPLPPPVRELLERRTAVLGKAYRLFYHEPLHIVRGEGVWLFDAADRKYLDMYNNVPHVGHCHPRVVDALCRQIGTLNTHTRYLHNNIVECAGQLLATIGDPIDTVMFACTGSEANELALRLARAYTGGTGVIVADFAYHGNTQATSDISPEETPLAQLPDHVAVVPCPDVYRGEHRDDTAADRYANHVADALRVLDDRRIRPAAFVVDTILSSSGVLELPDGYLRKAAAIVRDAGALFIADEVQPGFGRTGSNFWGYQAADVVPDIVTMGKPMGNGHPVSAIAARRDIVDAFASQGSYFNTFGGNPVSCAAVLAVLEVIEEDGLQANARDVGRHLRSGLAALADRHSAIGDVRGNGLFQGVDFVTDRDTRHPDARLAKLVMNGLRDRGVLTGVIGPHSNILKIRPPMVATAEHADYLLERLDEVLASL